MVITTTRFGGFFIERSIMAATGANYRGGSIEPLYNAGHRKVAGAITAR